MSDLRETTPPSDIYVVGNYYAATLMSHARKVPIGIHVYTDRKHSALDRAQALADAMVAASLGDR